MRHFRSGLSMQRASTLARKLDMMGSTLSEIVEDPSLRVRKFVMQEKMQTSASGLICFSDSARTSESSTTEDDHGMSSGSCGA